MITQLVVPPLLVTNGLAAGVLLWSAAAGMPFMLVLPAQGYVRAQQFLGRRAEPLQPILFVLTAVAGVALTVATSGPARWLFGLATAITLAVIVISVRYNVPIKRWVESLDALALPADFEQRDPRRSWAAWNLARTVLAMLALTVNATAVGLLT
jgi:Domain of unknown function (DUF1772)